MRRLAIILCLIPRVIYGTYTVQHHTYSHVSRKSRSSLPTLHGSYVYRQFDSKPGVYSSMGEVSPDPYFMNEPPESKSIEKLRNEPVSIYDDIIMPHTISPVTSRDTEYEIARAAANARYDSSRRDSDAELDKLRAVMHYNPPVDAMNEMLSGYDTMNEFHTDDDDIRSNTNMYDNWPYFYHSPYEYEHNKDLLDTEKAKDKRYIGEGSEVIIPVHEEVDETPQKEEVTTKATHFEMGDNPMTGEGPFFNFVLNDYFERSGEDDPLTFKGLDWGRDFDHETYMPELEDIKRSRRLENGYYTTMRPVHTTYYDDTGKLTHGDSSSVRGHRHEQDRDRYDKGSNKLSNHKSKYENKEEQYKGFKDFLDSFANKFGSEDHKRNANFIQQNNQDKGENRKGFHRVYHKDEYQEDKEFYDNKNSSTRSNLNGSDNAHVGGSEAYLRSTAAAATGNQSKAASNSGNTNDEQFENTYKGHDNWNSLENNFNKYRDVARRAALSNDADYSDHYRI